MNYYHPFSTNSSTMEDYRDLATANNELISGLDDTSVFKQFLIDHGADTLEEFFLNAEPKDILELIKKRAQSLLL